MKPDASGRIRSSSSRYLRLLINSAEVHNNNNDHNDDDGHYNDNAPMY